MTRLAIHHSFPGQGESESAERIAIAARRIGLNAKIVVDRCEIPPFDPDLVLCLSHHEGKTTRYPTYGVMLVPTAWYQTTPEALERILSYDGYLTTSEQTAAWITGLTTACYGRPARIAAYINTMPATSFVPVTLDAPKLAYIGGNWDGWRHLELLKALEHRNCLRCYGPADRWRHMAPAAYGGPVPFDGHSALAVYRAAGAGLGIDRADFIDEALPSVRIFEITAAAAAAIMGDTPFVRRAFGETVWYFDPTAPARVMAWQIQRHLAGIAAHPEAARERVLAAHTLFNRTFALERLLPNVLALHRQVQAEAPRPTPTVETLAFCRNWWAANGGRHTPLVLFQDLTPPAPADRIETEPLPPGLSGRLEVHVQTPPGQTPRGRVTLAGRAGAAGTPRAFDLGPDAMTLIGDVWRRIIPLDALPEAARGLVIEITPASGGDLALLGLGLRLTVPDTRESLARIAAEGAVWIYGTGEGGRRVAETLLRVTDPRAPSPLAGFIDDFRIAALLGHEVRPLALTAPLMHPGDAVVIASQHWASLWPRLAGLPPRRLYTAHPGYGTEATRLPPWPVTRPVVDKLRSVHAP